MHKGFITLVLLATIAGCTTKRSAEPAPKKKLVVTVVDYSASYHSLITLDSQNVQELFHCVGTTGGTVAHIGIQNNSDLPVHISRIERADTASEKSDNIYLQARQASRNSKAMAAYSSALQQKVSTFLQETRKYSASHFTDLQSALDLAHSTVCEPIYTEGSIYKRFVLILSDMRQDLPVAEGNTTLKPIDVCNATVVLVRPSTSFSKDTLQTLFNGAEVHLFSNLSDALSFIHQQ